MGKRGGRRRHDKVGQRRQMRMRQPVKTTTATAGDCKKTQSAEADRIGGRAREDAVYDGGLGGGRRQGEGEEEVREAHRMDRASRRGDRGNH